MGQSCCVEYNSISTNDGADGGQLSTTDRQHDKLLLLGSESSDTVHMLRSLEYQHHVQRKAERAEYLRSQRVMVRKHCVSSILKLYHKSQTLFNYHPVNYAKFDTVDVNKSHIVALESALNNMKASEHSVDKLSGIEFAQLANYIKSLWKKSAIQLCWELIFSSPNQMKHFLDQIDSIMCDDEYVASYNDIMLLSQPNLSEITLAFDHCSLSIVALQGSKCSSSRKWMQSFDNATGIIYALSLADLIPCSRREGSASCTVPRTSALEASMLQFDNVVNNKAFADKPLMVIVDEYEAFCEAIRRGELVIPGVTRKNPSCAYTRVRKMLVKRALAANVDRNVYVNTAPRLGCSPSQVTRLFNSVQHIKVSDNLVHGGIL